MTKAPRAAPPGLVFTDLDGTLLDHHTYRFDAARPALERLGDLGVVLVLCSSKTRAEMVAVQDELGLLGPFIVENGGAVFLRGGGALAQLFPQTCGGAAARVFGTPHAQLREVFCQVRERLGLPWEGFGDASVEQVMSWTGLPREQAARAWARDFSEPFLWEPEPTASVVAQVGADLERAGLHLTRGGRFWHLLGDNDKGRAVRWLLDAAGEVWGPLPSLSLGDSANDLPMLQETDAGVLVERPQLGHLGGAPGGILRVAGVGPVGWNRAVNEWLDELSEKGG